MGQLRINYPTKVETLERTEAARAIARWDPDWRQHVWNVDLVEFLSKFTYAFSYSNGTGWKDGPKAYDYKDFDLEFRKWYEVTYPLPEGYVKWQPTCEFCGELLDIGKETLHVKQWCIGRWAYLLDTRWTYPFGVWPATYAERYRREKEVTAEIEAFGFRVPGPYWKHLLQPAEQVLLDAGVFNDGTGGAGIGLPVNASVRSSLIPEFIIWRSRATATTMVEGHWSVRQKRLKINGSPLPLSAINFHMVSKSRATR